MACLNKVRARFRFGRYFGSQAKISLALREHATVHLCPVGQICLQGCQNFEGHEAFQRNVLQLSK